MKVVSSAGIRVAWAHEMTAAALRESDAVDPSTRSLNVDDVVANVDVALVLSALH